VTHPLEERLGKALEGQYQIERHLGKGAMATVFLAKDLRHDRTIALKLLPPDLATSSSAERFLREIRITAALQHPHILPLLDSGFNDGLCWYAMPYVTGESLREALTARGAMSLKDAARTAAEICKALAYAHSQHVVHRDVKPENIMLSGGMAIVMDFGLARALSSGHTGLTATGLPLGTPAYMSPEQVMGEDVIDARADIYGLGCVFYEMLTGRPPFLAQSAAVMMRQHVQEIPAPPSSFQPGIPAPVDKILARALAKKPGDRYQKAEEFLAQLEMVGALATLGEMGLGGEDTGPAAAPDQPGKPSGGGLFGKFFGKK
jgi:serine/threonine-protein kinase